MADEPYVLTVRQIRDEWQRRSGERLSKSRVHQIIQIAERKLRRGLAAIARERFGRQVYGQETQSDKAGA